jgi:hypothetical protein
MGDHVGSDNPMRFSGAFVDGLDLAAGFGRIVRIDTAIVRAAAGVSTRSA